MGVHGLGLFDSSRVIVTGKQEVKAMDLSFMCFDFAIRQDLVFTNTSEDEDGGDGNQYFTAKYNGTRSVRGRYKEPFQETLLVVY